MGADNGKHEVGDIVTPCLTKHLFGGKRKIPKGLKKGQHYRITSINRGIDGAYDWDDIYLEGTNFEAIAGRFCEFDLDTVKRK